MCKLLQGIVHAAMSLIAAAAAAPATAAPDERPNIQVVDGGWGGGEPAEIRKILAAVADEFPAPPGAGASPPLRVRHRFGGPMVLYDRDRDGAIVMYLSARDSRWYQYVYQFAHENCHVLSRFDRKEQGGDIQRDNQWFEEALCESASLYAIRRLAVKWCGAGTTDPQLREAAGQLRQYANQLLAERHRVLDPGTTFESWFARNEPTLRREPYLREATELVGAALLPLFEADPRRWEALAYLNPTKPLPGGSFADFLASWEAALPTELRPVVNDIRRLFGLGPNPAPGSSDFALRSPSPLGPGTGPGCGS